MVSYVDTKGNVLFEDHSKDWANSGSPCVVARSGPSSFLVASSDSKENAVLRRFEKKADHFEVKNFPLPGLPKLHSIQSSRHLEFLACASNDHSVWVAKVDDQVNLEKKLEVYSGLRLERR